MKFSCVKTLLILLLLSLSLTSYARDHLIYSVAEEIPMGFDNEVTKRNFYVNIGQNQGIKKGTTLNVYRIISKMNPYDNKKRINYKVEIGQLKVLHTEDESAITILEKKNDDLQTPLFEINSFMIGDHVSVNVN